MRYLVKCIYPFFVIVSVFIPRRKNIWVFGCRKGYIDNTKYFFEYASSKREFVCYWLANDSDELHKVKGLGYKAVLKNSFIGYWVSSISGISFICTGFTDVNRLLCLRGKVINFWHGTPIKKLYFSSERYSSKNRSVILYLQKKVMGFLISCTDFYYASNEFEREIVTASARMPINKSLALGAPRFDAIRRSGSIDILDDFQKKFKKIYLYAPTWRDGELHKSFLLLEKDLLDLNKMLLENDAVLIVKPHFNTTNDQFVNLGLERSNRIFYADDLGLKDINDLYRYADLLITDVSSALFDYLIFNKPVVIFMPDYKSYLSSNFGVYDYFVDILDRNAIINWSILISVLSNESTVDLASVELFAKIANELIELKSVNESIYGDLLNRFVFL